MAVLTEFGDRAVIYDGEVPCVWGEDGYSDKAVKVPLVEYINIWGTPEERAKLAELRAGGIVP